jgi:hypothetical protein
MANTDINLSEDAGTLVPSAPSVHVAKGDTVSFATDNGAPVVLFFSPGAASILSPAPQSPHAIAAHGKAAFTFSSSSPGAYSVFFGVDPKTPPPSFPEKTSQELFLEISSLGGKPPGFGGPGDVAGQGSLR